MREKVILINQDAGFHQRVEATLGKAYTVLSKKDGLEALEWLEKTGHADLIVADSCMPHLAVEDFLRTLRLHAAFRHVPVLVLSDLAHLTERRKYLGLGANDFMVMPISVLQLKNRVAHLIHHKASSVPV
jgi:DNA-binding response OmpR family regulator